MAERVSCRWPPWRMCPTLGTRRCSSSGSPVRQPKCGFNAHMASMKYSSGCTHGRLVGAVFVTTLGIGLLAALSSGATAKAATGPRVASINVCTDQLVLALADAEQIVGLSPFSRDAARSWRAQDAGRFRRLSGDAEDVLMLKPDLVVAGSFTKRATRELLKDKGVRVAGFDVAQSIDDVRDQMRRMGDLVAQPARAAAEIARLDTALERARTAAERTRYRVLPLARRGWVSGGDSLMGSLLSATGLANAADQLGVRSGGFASLEMIVRARPDFIVVADNSPFVEDQGHAFLLHPALEALYPPHRRIVVPERLTVCGGPMLVEALDRLTAEIERVTR
jgi:iron complex transport system substrate-binding protein